MAQQILVVDDDRAVRRSLQRALMLARFDVDVAEDGEAGLLRLAERGYDVIVLDVAMPRVDGIEFCERIRGMGDGTPILMLTARDAVDDRVAGLEAGADDYVVKPFALKELVARLRALLRRKEPSTAPALRFADLSLDREMHEVRRDGRRIELSRTEFALLEVLMENPRQVLTRAQLYERLWGYDPGQTSNALSVYVSYLRRKTEADGRPRLVQTVRGIGFALRE